MKACSLHQIKGLCNLKRGISTQSLRNLHHKTERLFSIRPSFFKGGTTSNLGVFHSRVQDGANGMGMMGKVSPRWRVLPLLGQVLPTSPTLIVPSAPEDHSSATAYPWAHNRADCLPHRSICYPG